MRTRGTGLALGIALALVFVPSGPARAETAPPKALASAAPAAVGMSAERLERLNTAMKQAVDEGRAAGIVTLVARRGRIVQWNAFGKQDLEAGTPMAKDTLFRIASQSKALTSVSAMVLIEEGKLLLSDPISKYIPAFKRTRVRVPRPTGHRKTPRSAPSPRNGRSRCGTS